MTEDLSGWVLALWENRLTTQKVDLASNNNRDNNDNDNNMYFTVLIYLPRGDLRRFRLMAGVVTPNLNSSLQWEVHPAWPRAGCVHAPVIIHLHLETPSAFGLHGWFTDSLPADSEGVNVDWWLGMTEIVGQNGIDSFVRLCWRCCSERKAAF